MNRELLFRGINIITEKMVFGDLNTKRKSENLFFINDGKYDHAVIPETVGQFTGLTDKNGVKIFDGDLIKSVANGVTEVRYDQQKACFILYSKKPGYWDFSVHACSDKIVIGSIYDEVKDDK